jgi:hypothetical protein
MQITHRIFLAASAIAVLAATTVAGTYIWNRINTDSGITAIAPLDPACDIQQGPCQARFADGSRISLSIVPRPIQALQPLQIRVTTEGLDAQEVAVDFQGLGMNMGYNRPRLKKEAEGQFSGSGMLSTCILERMSWEATVLAKADEGVMAAPFRFETIRP